MPIRSGNRVLATFGVTYYSSAMKLSRSRMTIIEAVRSTVAQIEAKL
jgi:IclR family mhp operon transcriptional activator